LEDFPVTRAGNNYKFFSSPTIPDACSTGCRIPRKPSSRRTGSLEAREKKASRPSPLLFPGKANKKEFIEVERQDAQC
jgi:outer membrane biosynthesis protein TonB